jgi:hypothetical protein
MVNYWPYISIAVALIIGAVIGYGKGKSDAHEEYLNREKQMQANEMWIKMMKENMGVKNG